MFSCKYLFIPDKLLVNVLSAGGLSSLTTFSIEHELTRKADHINYIIDHFATEKERKIILKNE